jgi:hypothetical protein
MFAANWFIIVSTLVAGLGFGGYASVTGLVRSINQYRCGALDISAPMLIAGGMSVVTYLLRNK